VDGHEPCFAELAASHSEQAVAQVDVVTVERERLTDAQTRDSQQAEERGVGRPAQPPRRPEAGGRLDERRGIVTLIPRAE
jgi:hypothetical protein